MAEADDPIADMPETIATAKKMLLRGEMSMAQFLAMIRKVGWTTKPREDEPDA